MHLQQHHCNHGSSCEWTDHITLGVMPLPLLFWKLRTVSPNTRHFCTVCNYAEKADLIKAYWNLKRKLWVATHFAAIINHPLFWKSIKIHNNMCLPPFFWGGDSISPCWNLLFPHSHELHKNTSVLMGICVRLRPSWDDMEHIRNNKRRHHPWYRSFNNHTS